MLIDRRSLRLHAPWIVILVLGTLLAVGFYGYSSWRGGSLLGGSSTPGLLFGIVGGLIIVFELLLWPRKARPWRLGSARLWMRAHIWLGLLTIPLIVMHSGFRLGGQLSTGVMVLFAIVIVSGLFGLLLQQWLPRTLLKTVPEETLHLQIHRASQLLAKEAEDLVEAATSERDDGQEVASDWHHAGIERQKGSEETPIVGARRRAGRILTTPWPTEPIEDSALVADAFYHQIQPYLRGGKRASRDLADYARSARTFDILRGQVGADAHSVLKALEECCDKRRQFDRQARLHWWLHGWLSVHLPVSVIMVIVMLVHAWFALKYM